MKRISLLLILVCTLGFVFAQNTDEKLAAQYYANGDYEKAAQFYKKIIRRNTSTYIYDNYLNCLIALENKKDALNLAQKQIKRHPKNYFYAVDKGYVLHSFGQKDEADAEFKKLIKSASKNRANLVSLSQSLNRRGFSDYTKLAYEEGVKKLGIESFWYQLAILYRSSSSYKDLVDLSLAVLDKNYTLYSQVYNILGSVLEDEPSIEYLQTQTLLYIQKKPNDVVFQNLLLDIYLQQGKFNSAFRQVKAMDKRQKLNGNGLTQFAETCVGQKQYDYAIKAYQYIIDQNLGSSLLNPKGGLLNAQYLKLKTSLITNDSLANQLANNYKEFFTEFDLNHYTAFIGKRHAEVLIYYSNDLAQGIQLLEKIIVLPRLQAKFIAESKLLLGDAYLIQNNIWDAKIMYGQVDKQFKEDMLGQEAKFRNAKLSYFTGDFDWATSQLDVLKTATSQLISNNAIELSLLIQDNIGLDTTQEAMKEYANAAFLLFQNKVSECQQVLNLLPFKYPKHQLEDEIYYLQAQLEVKKVNYKKALTLYKKVYENHHADILADNALFQAAELLLFGLNEPEKALVLYEKLILDYNSSLYVVESRKKYYALKEGQGKEDLFFEGLN